MRYYDQIAKSYSELYDEEQSRKLSIIKDHIKIKKSDKLLDVGCGTGISSQFSCTVVGIDPSIELLKQNTSRNKAIGIAEELPFKDNSFNYVISVTSIHNFDDIIKAIKEIKRVGKNNFIFSVMKKSDKLIEIKRIVESNFRVSKIIEEEKDVIFFCCHHT